METERIALSQRERDRLRVLQEVQQGHLTQVEAAARVKLSDRQVRRLLLRIGERVFGRVLDVFGEMIDRKQPCRAASGGRFGSSFGVWPGSRCPAARRRCERIEIPAALFFKPASTALPLPELKRTSSSNASLSTT